MPYGARTAARPLQERAVATREALLAAAEALAAEGGEAAVTTSRAAAAAGVSVGAVYRYFADREALLLAAYDRTVERIAAACAAELGRLDPAVAAADAARALLGAWLAAAEAIPAHAPLLRAMRAVRPVGDDQGTASNGVVEALFSPFLARYAGGNAGAAAVDLAFLGALMGTLVDLCLIAEEPGLRRRRRADAEAHMLLALRRLLEQAGEG